MQTDKVLRELETLYPDARAELHFSNPFETLVATILSAQCTDKRVNMVTEKLFPLYPDAFAMAKLEPEELEPYIRSCGVFRMKAKHIVEASRMLVEKYDGQVPADRKKLMELPGVGQKTAGVVLLAAFGEDEIPVDTHVFRVSNRIGLAHANTPNGVEEGLKKVIPKEMWSFGHHLLIWHGRRICHSQRPECDRCPLRGELCEYSRKDEG